MRPRPYSVMNSLLWPRKLAAAAVLCVVALAQSPRPGESSLELEPSLFVQLPGGKITPGAVQLVWIPEPLEKYCLGKTHVQCASMDFCIRTTTKNVSTCRNLAVDLAHLPAYPPEMRPRRMLSVPLSRPNERLARTPRLCRARAQKHTRTFFPDGANQGQSRIHPNTRRR